MNTSAAKRTVQRASHLLNTAARTRTLLLPARGATVNRHLHLLRPAPPILRKYVPKPCTTQLRRESSQTPASNPLTDRTEEDVQNKDGDAALRKAQEPAYEMTFTCRKCLTRSSHRITKQAYHFGTVLITCPGCKNRHLISDHLKIFSDKSITLEDILKEKGQYLRKGRLGADGDVEFYDDKH